MNIKMGLIAIIYAVAVMAMADFDADMRAAAALCKDKKHEESIQACIKTGEACKDPEQRYQAFRDAAMCARLHLGGEARGLELAKQINVEPYAKACRAVVYQWQTSSPKVVAEFENEDFTEWPEDLAAIGFTVRGMAYYNLKNGQLASRDYLRAFQFAKGFEKWSALTKLGDTYWKLLDDERLAEACYRKCMSDFGGWPGLQARVNLGEMLLSQRRYDTALQCLKGDKHGGYWQVSLLYVEAKVYSEMGRTDEAIADLEAALKTQGIHPSQAKGCEKMLADLKSKLAPQTAPPGKETSETQLIKN